MAPLPLQLTLYFAYLLAPHTYLPFQPTASLTKDMNCRFAEETTGSTTATATTRVASCHRYQYGRLKVRISRADFMTRHKVRISMADLKYVSVGQTL